MIELPIKYALDNDGNPYAPATGTNAVFGGSGENLDIILGRAGLMGLPFCEGHFATRSTDAVISAIHELTPVFERGTNLLNGVRFVAPNKGTYALSIGGGQGNVVSNNRPSVRKFNINNVVQKLWIITGMNTVIGIPGTTVVTEMEQGEYLTFGIGTSVALTSVTSGHSLFNFWFGQIADARMSGLPWVAGRFNDRSLTANTWNVLTPSASNREGDSSLISGNRFVASEDGIWELFVSTSQSNAAGAPNVSIALNSEDIGLFINLLNYVTAPSTTGIPGIYAKHRILKNNYFTHGLNSGVAQTTIFANNSVRRFLFRRTA